MGDSLAYERVSHLSDLESADTIAKGIPLDGLDWKIRHEMQDMNNLIDRLVKSGDIPKSEAKELHQHSGQPPRWYGLPKVHKDGVPLRSIESCTDYISTMLQLD